MKRSSWLMLLRLKMQMHQPMQLGRARDVIQSMDKQELIAYLNLIMIVLAAVGGYLAGSYNG